MKEKIIVQYTIADLKNELKSMGVLRNKKNIDKAIMIIDCMDIANFYQEIRDNLEAQFDEKNR